MLVLFCGLPGAGKTTLSRWVTRELGCTLLSVDVIEAALFRGGLAPQPETGTAVLSVVEALADQHLRLGRIVVVDSVLPDEAARAPMRALAHAAQVPLAIVEVVCSDPAVHREHYLSRRPLVPYHSHDWEHVERVRRRYVPWQDDRLVLDAVDPADVNGPRAVAHLMPATVLR